MINPIGLSALNIAIQPVSPDLKAQAYFWCRASHDCGASIIYLGCSENHLWQLGDDTVTLRTTPPVTTHKDDVTIQRKIHRYMAEKNAVTFDRWREQKAAVV